MSKLYDIVLWGATGFTGELTAEYIASKCEILPCSTIKPKKGQYQLRFAIAGRNVSKLEEVKSKMLSINTSCKNVDILIGNTTDQQSVDTIVANAEVVLAAVGPFALYGTPIVDACVRLNAHYCDITAYASVGETKWARSIIDKYHEEAKSKRLKIVPFCGYDSIPSDLGAWMVVDHIRNQLHCSPGRVTTYIGPVKGAISGGTFATMLNELSIRRQRSKFAPNNLVPSGSKSLQPKPVLLPRKDKDINKYVYPWLMGMVNTLVVRRSAYLNSKLYGDNFAYNEAAASSSFFTAWTTTLMLLLFVIFGSFSWTRSILTRFFPASGQGPSKEQRDAGMFVHTVVGFSTSSEGSPHRVVARVAAQGDPGYKVTSQIVGEAALCLALDQRELPDEFGVLTPSTATGKPLLERLKKSGITFEIMNVK